MPKGPRGEKRPADAIGRAIMVAKIATGEIVEEASNKTTAARQPVPRSPERAKGGKARASALTPKARSEIARKAAAARWSGTGAARAKKEPQEPSD